MSDWKTILYKVVILVVGVQLINILKKCAMQLNFMEIFNGILIYS